MTDNVINTVNTAWTDVEIAIKTAPEKGLLFMSSRKLIVWARYDSPKEARALIGKADGEILELHMFDRASEFRAVRKGNKDEYIIMTIIDQKGSEHFVERVVCEPSINGVVAEKNEELEIEVVNYYEYDDNDLIRFTNYRLKEV